MDNIPSYLMADTDPVDISTLKHDPQNARKHTKANLDLLEKSIEEVGLWRSIAIDEENTIIAGNATVEVAGQMGITRVKIVEADPEEIVAVRRVGLTEEQKRRYALFDNRAAELAEWDIPVLLDQDSDLLHDLFSDEQMEKFRQEIDQLSVGDPDEEAEVDLDLHEENQPVTQSGDVWQLGDHRLVCGDATDAGSLDLLAGKGNAINAKMAFADPPYNVGLKYHGYSDTLPDEVYREFCHDYLNKLLSESPFAVITPGKWNEAIYYTHPDYLDHAIWHKRFGLTHGTMYRAMVTEPVVFLGKKPTNKWLDTDYLEYMTDRSFDHESHPAIKPVALLAHLMVKLTDPGDVVLEAFGGSGTTIIAGEQVDRSVFSIELDPHYVEVAVRRWRMYTRQEPILTRDGVTIPTVWSDDGREVSEG